MDMMEMLTAREQLMEDIDCIIEDRFSEVFPHTEDYEEFRDELIETLCDAVCKNFPAKWYKLVSRPTSCLSGTLEVAIRQTLCL